MKVINTKKEQQAIKHKINRKIRYFLGQYCHIDPSPAASYLLFEVLLIYCENKNKKPSEISKEFSDDLYFATGVMLSGNLFSHSNLCSYVRLHSGSDPLNLEEIIHRFQNAKFHYVDD
ncbi:unnamed protein product [Adineta ricciae]|uniref:Uncharacterized protein n=1 Tax=Adineta ricciae TaxID=249248 RepID=A0A816DXW2_ADIRI|nr:unnamed protein product [Adineta ricciae]